MDLFDYLIEKCGCGLYVSDLPRCFYIRTIISKMEDPGMFPLEEWNDLVSYLLRMDQKFNSCQEAKEYLEYILPGKNLPQRRIRGTCPFIKMCKARD